MPRWAWLFLACLLAIAAALRLPRLDATPFSADEIRHVLTADRPLADVPAAVAQQTGVTPLQAFISRTVLRRRGRTESALRVPAALVGTATVAVLFAVGRALFERPPWIAAILLALSAAHIDASREADAAALSALLVPALLLAAWRLVQRPTRQAWLWLVLIGTLALYAHYGAAPVWLAALAVILIAAMVRAASLRGAIGLTTAALCCLALFAPWIWRDAQAGRGGLLMISRITVDTFTGVGRAFAADGRSVTWVGPGLLAIGMLAGAVRAIARHRLAGVLLSTAVAAGIACTLLVTYLLPYRFHPHQVLFVLPVYLLLAAHGLEWPLSLLPARWRTGGYVVLFAGVVVASGTALRAPAITPATDWRAVGEIVGNNAWSDDTVAAPQVQDLLTFYAPGLAHQVLPEAPATALPAALSNGTRGWLVAPLSFRLSAAWPAVAAWMETATVVDLSAGDDPLVLYGGRTSRMQLLREAAGFDLPNAALARGALLRELLQLAEPRPIVLRFVDQLAAAEPSLSLRNPELLGVVSLLARDGEANRARALAARLASNEPDWPEAQQALAALE